MVELKLRKIGDSLGVVLPEEVIERLHAAEGEALLLFEADDGSYRLAAGKPGPDDKMKLTEDIIARYPNTLRILAQ